jgi:hypothetical protein
VNPVPLNDGSPADQARLFLNGTSLGSLKLTRIPGEFGSHERRLPRDLVRVGMNTLTLEIDRMVSARRIRRQHPAVGSDGSVGLRFWYILITPADRLQAVNGSTHDGFGG